MFEEFDKSQQTSLIEKEEIFSKAVRAGKRTYFFDVKATRNNNNDYYLTITESKRINNGYGTSPQYQKHKIFLYKEDFKKFNDGLAEALKVITDKIENNPDLIPENSDNKDTIANEKFVNLDFEDLV